MVEDGCYRSCRRSFFPSRGPNGISLPPVITGFAFSRVVRYVSSLSLACCIASVLHAKLSQSLPYSAWRQRTERGQKRRKEGVNNVLFCIYQVQPVCAEPPCTRLFFVIQSNRLHHCMFYMFIQYKWTTA